MESSRTFLALRTSLVSRTHFEVLGLGFETSSPRKLSCPRLEDSTIFEPLKFRWKTSNLAENLQRPFFLVSSSRDRLKKNFEDFFLENTCVCVLGPWPRIFFVSLASSLVSSTPPLLPTPLKESKTKMSNIHPRISSSFF